MNSSLSLTWRQASVILAVVWAVGGGILLASWWAHADDRIRNAPRCAPHELFTPTVCQATLPGSVTEITSDEVVLDVAARETTMQVGLKGDLSGIAGTWVDVTFYRGAPIRVEGPKLKADAEGSPADDAYNLRMGGFAVVFIGSFLVIVNLRCWLRLGSGDTRPPGGRSPRRFDSLWTRTVRSPADRH